MVDKSILTPVSLWKDFVVERSFMESCISSFCFDGVETKNVYISGRTIGDSQVRIYCTVACPQNLAVKNFVIIVGDPSESINFELIKIFVNMGYGVLMPDLRGNDGVSEGNFTRYPQEIRYADYVFSQNDRYNVKDSVKNTCWYEWACVVRSTIVYAKSELNAVSIALVGVKEGADVCWMSLTENVDCFVDFFGAGWTAYKDIADRDNALLSSGKRMFVAGIDAESYAPYCNCPVIYFTATNSKDFSCEECSETVLRTKGDKFFVFSAGQALYLSKQSIFSCETFLKKYLKGDNVFMPEVSPSLEIVLKDGVVRFDFMTSELERVESFKLNISSGESDAYKKNWVLIYEGKDTSFAVNEKDFSDNVTAFLSVRYEGGAEFCSPITTKKIGNHPKKLMAPLFTGNKNDNTFISRAIESEVVAGLFYGDEGVVISEGPFGIKGAYSKNGLVSYKITEYGNLLENFNDIKFDLYCPSFVDFIVGIFCDENGKEVHYKYNIKIKGAKVWQNFCISFDDFKSDSGKSIKDNSTIYAFSFYSSGKFIVNNVLVY